MYALYGALQLFVWLTRRSDTALMLWALANFAGGCGGLLIGLCDHAPDWASIEIGNSMIILGWMLLAQGMRNFAGQPIRFYWLFIPSLLIFGLFTFVPTIGSSLVARIQIVVGLYIVINLVIIYDCWRAEQREHLVMRRLLMGLFGLSILAATLCVVRASDIQPTGNLMAGDLFQSAGILFIEFMLMAWNLIVMLMANERLCNRLKYNAQHDVLTNVLNRAGFLQLAPRLIKRCIQDRTTVSVLMMDLDHFKQVNDRHGHIAGDWVLCAFADVVRKNIRPSDLLTRCGGEEFYVLLAGTTATDATALAERIRVAFTQVALPVRDGFIRATVSIGVVEIQDPDELLAELLVRADKALYRAKLQGRNQVCVAPGGISTMNQDQFRRTNVQRETRLRLSRVGESTQSPSPPKTSRLRVRAGRKASDVIGDMNDDTTLIGWPNGTLTDRRDELGNKVEPT